MWVKDGLVLIMMRILLVIGIMFKVVVGIVCGGR